MYFISDLLIPGSNKIKRCLLQGKKDESTYSTHDWPVVRTNKECVSSWKNAMSDISNNYGTLRQSIRWTSYLNSHRKINATVNADQTVICVKVSDTEIRYHAAYKIRYSYRHKTCHVAYNFTSSNKMHVDASLSDCVWLEFCRSTLNISAPPVVVSTFERWCSKNIWWKLTSD